jgi:hypothetical protein
VPDPVQSLGRRYHMNGTEYLDFLMRLTLPVVADELGRPCIRIADIPARLRMGFEAYLVGVNGPVIDGQPCASHGNWNGFLHRERARQYERMRTASLELGERGPSAADLAAAPTLSDWVPLRDPDFPGALLLGRPTNHPFCTGPISNTSRLCGLDPHGRWARTASRWYRLDHVTTLADLNVPYPGVLARWGGCELTMVQVLDMIQADRERGGGS